LQAAERTPQKLVYEGSVKRVFAPESASSDKLWFEFTDDYSVFDWGKMPDTIAQKGRALTVMGAWFFQTLAPAEFWSRLPAAPALKKFNADPVVAALFAGDTYKKLAQDGLPTHFYRLADLSGRQLSLAEAAASSKPAVMEVTRADVVRPSPTVVLGQTLYYYPSAAAKTCRLIPLEVVFRFGMPAGSSLKERLERNPEYAQQLGLKNATEGSWFTKPVLEFFTKLEPKDRLLTMGEALAISSLDAQQFCQLSELAQLCALALYDIFAERGIELWDGKFEFILDNGRIKLADSIGPDELRLIYKGLHLSKEIIRRVYRGSAWERSLKQAQKLAAERQSQDWKVICRDQLKSLPEPLTASFKRVVDKMYPTLVNHLAAENLFAAQPDLDGLVTEFQALQ
jgi:phosphoribosylaminoimidazole-succinocarboxamide synthase